jgi:hypothetical protein
MRTSYLANWYVQIFLSHTHDTPKLYDEEAITQTCTEIHNVETILSNRCLTACSQFVFVVIFYGNSS